MTEPRSLPAGDRREPGLSPVRASLVAFPIGDRTRDPIDLSGFITRGGGRARRSYLLNAGSRRSALKLA